MVVGRVTEVSGKRWKVAVNARQEATLQLSAVDLPGGVQRRRTAHDELNMRELFEETDLISVRRRRRRPRPPPWMSPAPARWHGVRPKPES